MGYTRRYISFDLDDKRTKQCLLDAGYSDDTSKAYRDIRKYMEKNGFEWNQKSAYISKEPMSKAQATEVIAKITEEIPYLKGAFERVKNIPANLEEFASLANNGLASFDKEVAKANSIVEEIQTENSNENTTQASNSNDGLEL